jgi:uncharacterized membrane-anchored protein
MSNQRVHSSVRSMAMVLLLVPLSFCCLVLWEGPAHSDDQVDSVQKLMSLPWLQGPNEGRISDVATLKFGEEYRFLGTSGTKQFLELSGNLPNDRSFTLAKKNLSWFAVFSFDESGYVKDDEVIDPDVLLEQLKQSNRAGAEERRKRGLQILTLDGWFVSPRYDTQTKHLEWGTRISAEHETGTTVNFTTRLLGRRGVMSATLVSNPETLEQDVMEFKNVLKGFEYKRGENYTEFRQGDKVAEYGLAALVVGGAAAVAAKSGAGKAIFKVLGVAFVVGIGAIWSFVKKILGKKG